LGGVGSVVDEVDINVHSVAFCCGAHHGADAHRRSSATTNDAAEVAFANSYFQHDLVVVCEPSTFTASGSSTIERTTCVSTAVATGAGTTFAVSDTMVD